MESIKIQMEGHEQRIRTVEREILEMKEIQAEIRSINETLVTLATEIKYANEHLLRHEKKIEEIEVQPKMRLQQILTAIISAIAGGIISIIIKRMI